MSADRSVPTVFGDVALSARSAGVVRWLIYGGLILAAAVMAFLLRFDFDIPASEYRHLWLAIVVWLPVKTGVFHLLRIDRSSWRHTSSLDASQIAVGNVVGSLCGGLVLAFLDSPGFPRSVYILDFCLCLLATVSVPLAIRILSDSPPRPARTDAMRRILIYGAGAAGLAVLREIRCNSRLNYRVCGFVDDDARKKDTDFSQMRVLGSGPELATIAARHQIDEVLIAVPSATGGQMTTILQHCQNAGLTCKTIPGLTDVIQGVGLATQIRDVAVEDLLGRTQIHLDQSAIHERIGDRVVLVTGAAGSIGSEICRQVARFNPAAIVGYEIAESALFHLHQEFARRFPDVPFYPEIGSIQNRARLGEVMAIHRPSIVFHAGAYKHVPMMELHPFEAVENNVFGTLNAAQLAAEHGVDDFVMISSDKAVRPTSVMGTTKRIAEILIRSLPQRGSRLKCVSVRFGNVLGSNGSVVPIFKDQIARGGPVTVTHPDMVRYFMTIPEASQLVLQAATMGRGGEIFVLDMGEQVRIVDLARKLILLSGRDPEAIGIEFTGVRPGEKLYEEIQTFDEDVLPTDHEKIRSFAGPTAAWPGLEQQIVHLRQICARRDLAELILALTHLVPEYDPSEDLMARVRDASASGFLPPEEAFAS